LRITPSTVILITGGSGSLGWTLGGLLAPRCKVIASYCSNPAIPRGAEAVRVDLRDQGTISQVVDRSRPDIIIHLAAVTDPDACEQDPEVASRINFEATSEIADAARKCGCKLVFASTDLVFDGARGDYTEDDSPHPLSRYGMTKLRAEQAVSGTCKHGFTFRSSLIYGRRSPSRPNFLSRVLGRLAKGERIQLFTDQRRNPIFVDDLARAVIEAIGHDVAGLYHLGGADVVTRYQFGKLVCQAFGYDEDLLVPIRMRDFTYAAERPLDSTLDITRFTEITGFVPTRLAEALEDIAAGR
jgi:dTDP-4-dehydrorhamnose reductase